jgi:long-subunit fatty acid transport protein
MVVRGLKILVWCWVLFAWLCGVSQADQEHYINLLVGDRASGMGGAYTAISDDTSGMFYNPAGIAYSTGQNLSASVNAYNVSTKTYKNVIGGKGWTRQSTSLLPNFFGVIQPVGLYKFGFSYAVPDSAWEDQSQTFEGFPSSIGGVNVQNYHIKFNNDDNTYNIGPSLAWEISKRVAIGGTLYVFHRRQEYIQNELTFYDTGQYEWSNTYYQIVERGYRPIVGLMWAPVDRFSMGLSVSKVYITSTNVEAALTQKQITYDGNTVDYLEAGSSEKKKYPTQVRLGAAYFPSGSLLLSIDGIYDGAVSDTYRDRGSVLNMAAGLEYYFSRNWAFRGGFYTDLANTHSLEEGRVNQPENVDLYGLSMSLSNFTRNTSVTLGASMAKGSGKAQITGDTSVQDLDIETWMVFLSSNYSY